MKMQTLGHQSDP